MKTAGQVAYETYIKSPFVASYVRTGSIMFEAGFEPLKWDELKDEPQKAWEEAAGAVINKIKEEIITLLEQ